MGLLLSPGFGPSFKASGLTGSVASSRYVGATASGAPGSGAHLVGDFVIDQTGSLWVCTGAGTPGTWAQIGSGGAVTLLDSHTTPVGTEASYTTPSLASGKALLLSVTARDTSAGTSTTLYRLNFNADVTSGHYASLQLQGNNVTALSQNQVLTQTFMNGGQTVQGSGTASRFGGSLVYIPDYAATDKFKPILNVSGSWNNGLATGISDQIGFGSWEQTAAITTITFAPSSANFAAGCTFNVWRLN